MAPAQARVARRSKAGSHASVPVRQRHLHARLRRRPASIRYRQRATIPSLRSFIADAALGNVGQGCDSGMWMEPETRERFSLIVDQVEKYEGFQKTAKVGRRHESCDGPVTLAARPPGDTSNDCVLGFYI